VAGNRDFLNEARAADRVGGALLKPTVIGLERIDRIFAETPEPRPVRFSAEYEENLNRGYQRGLSSARIIDTDWDVVHCMEERPR
jgi:hypothetical protein